MALHFLLRGLRSFVYDPEQLPSSVVSSSSSRSTTIRIEMLWSVLCCVIAASWCQEHLIILVTLSFFLLSLPPFPSPIYGPVNADSADSIERTSVKKESPSTGGGSKAFSLRHQLPEDIPLLLVPCPLRRRTDEDNGVKWTSLIRMLGLNGGWTLSGVHSAGIRNSEGRVGGKRST